MTVSDEIEIDPEMVESQKLPDEPEEIEEPEAQEEEAEETAEVEPEEDGDDAAEEDESDEEEEEERPRRRGSAQKRIAELTRARHEAERRAAAAEQEAQMLRAQQEQPAEVAKEPQPDDFKTWGEYTRALARWEGEQVVQQRLAELGKQADANARQQAQKAQVAALQAWIEDSRQEYEDFDDVVLNDAVTITPHMAEVLIEHDRGASVAYYLGKHPREAREIAALSPVQAAVRLERIASTLKQRPKPTKAPEPAKPVKASRPVSRKRTPERAKSMEEYYKVRTAQMRK